MRVGDLVRRQIWKSGQPGKATWNARDSQKAPAGGNFSDEMYRAHSTRPAQGIRQTSYRIATLADVEERGMYVRTQLLKIPEGTLAYVTEESEDDDGDGDDSDDDDTDGNDDAVIQNAQTVDPRPLVPKKHRYRMGETPHFSQAFFEGDVDVGGLESDPRIRLGVVTELDRERPPSKQKGANRGRYLYTIEFENGQETEEVDALPLDRDPEVTFVREMPGDG